MKGHIIESIASLMKVAISVEVNLQRKAGVKGMGTKDRQEDRIMEESQQVPLGKSELP